MTEENESKLKEFFNEIANKIDSQPWFQELKAKWNELTREQKNQVKVGTTILSVVLLLITGAVQLSHVRTVKTEYENKSDIYHLLTDSAEALKNLKTIADQNNLNQEKSPPDWKAYFSNKSHNSGIDPKTIQINPPTTGPITDLSKEVFYEIVLKKINIKQLVQFAHHIENGNLPIRVRNLNVNTIGSEGYINASIELSAFELKKQQ